MDKTMLTEAIRIKAGAGDQRAFLVGSMDFSEGGQRVEQTQQTVDCMHAVGLHVDIDDVVLAPGSSDSREKYSVPSEWLQQSATTPKALPSV